MDYKEQESPPDPSNSLIHEKSPYLLQHAHQPVHWQPWSDEAFEEAQRLNRPVFLSIGYSTCHWCHVMARESFEDPDVARLLNDGFISIKVDREERPDIDQIYMAACLMMTGSGGWPLTIIMTPEKKPFFAATYLPKQSRFGMVGLLDLLSMVRTRWDNDDPAIRAIGEEITSILDRSGEGTGVLLDRAMVQQGYRDLAQHFDPIHGGFGPPPKFPSPHHLFFLLRYWWRTQESEALRMVEVTLQAMRLGGIYDHVGFGFHRYAVDAEWQIPHFEKMLYDQALIALAFLETFLATGNPWYADTVREIFTYVIRDLLADEGGFYAAEDAESEGTEGRFYLWTRDELNAALNPEQRAAFFQVFRVLEAATGRSTPPGAPSGASVLSRHTIPSFPAEGSGGADKDLSSDLVSAISSLFKVRETRIRPRKDTKILADWNGLVIAALAQGGSILSNPQYLAAAEKAMNFILQRMRTGDGRLFHESIDGIARISGFIDDYAAVLWGLIELYEATFREEYLKEALSLVDVTSRYFRDADQGGYYFTPSDGEHLLIRRKERQDGAYPSGNALMMRNLLRLARLTGRPEFEVEAHALWNGCSGPIRLAVSGYTALLTAADEALGPFFCVVIVGDPEEEDTRSIIDALRKRFIPAMDVLLVPTGDRRSAIERVAGFVSTFQMVGGQATAYLCTGYTCHQPTTSLPELLRWVEEA